MKFEKINTSFSDLAYVQTLAHLLEEGVPDSTRHVRAKWKDGNPAHAVSLPGPVVYEYDISSGDFPVITTRNFSWEASLKEIDWIFRDKSNSVDVLEGKYGVKWWRPWADENGSIGRSYGWQIKNRRRYVEGVGLLDQMDWLLWKLQNEPDRRMIVSFFDPENEVNKKLQECAYETIWSVVGDTLNMTLIQRSSDWIVAGMINAFQYAILLHQVAISTGYKPGTFIHFIQDVHLYDRHREQAQQIIDGYAEVGGEENEVTIVLPTSTESFYDLNWEHYHLELGDAKKYSFEIAE